jgi:hypothetical protein
MPAYLRACRRVQRFAPGTTLAVALICAAHPVRSQQAAASPEFRTEANFVRVDVYATRNGSAVTDLRREDFELFEDKSAQQTDQFAHIVTGSGGVPETRSDPSTVGDVAQAAETSSAGVMVLFLDVSVKLTAPGLAPCEYEVRFRAKAARSAAPSSQSVHVSVPASPESGGAMFFVPVRARLVGRRRRPTSASAATSAFASPVRRQRQCRWLHDCSIAPARRCRCR